MELKKNLIIIITILGIGLLIYYLINLVNRVTIKENFTTNINGQYGNILFNNTITGVEDNTVILLPGRFKITGIEVNTPSGNNINDNYNKRYKVYIADNEDDIVNPKVRKQINCGNNKSSILDINKKYNDPTGFEKEESGLYVGKVLMIESDNTNADILGFKKLPPTLSITVLGLEPFAPGFKDYDNMIKITTNSDKDIKVGYIKFTNVTENKKYKIKYSNSIDNNNNKYAINGPIKIGFEINSNNRFIYLSEPVIVQNIHIQDEENSNTLLSEKKNHNTQGDFVLYGYENVNKRDINNFKLQQQKFDAKHMIVEGEKCPNVGEMINKQLQAQQICEALEYKDKTRNKKLAYEKDKIYLGKLAKQDKEIEELETLVKELITKKNNRIENNKSSNIDEIEKELRRVENVRKEAEEYLANSKNRPVDFKMKLNLDPEFENIKGKITI